MILYARRLGAVALTIAGSGCTEGVAEVRASKGISAAIGNTVQALAPSVAMGDANPNLWENTSTTVTCSDGDRKLLYSYGHTDPPTVLRIDESDCFASNPRDCRGTIVEVEWDTPTNATLLRPAHGDNLLLTLADNSVILVHQAAYRDFNGKRQRGVEQIFRSTDCGASFTPVATIDPAESAYAGGIYVRKDDECQNQPNSTGLDRPEIWEDRDGTLWLTVIGDGRAPGRRLFCPCPTPPGSGSHCAGGDPNVDGGAGAWFSNQLLFRSTNKGQTWTLITDFFNRSPFTRLTSAVLTTGRSGNVYLLSCRDEDRATVEVYKPGAPATPALNLRLGSVNCAAAPNSASLREMRAGRLTSLGIVSAGQIQGHDVLRATYPAVESVALPGGGQTLKQVQRVVTFRFNPASNAITALSDQVIRAAGTGSILEFTAIEIPNARSQTADFTETYSYYWTETDVTPAASLFSAWGAPMGNLVERSLLARGRGDLDASLSTLESTSAWPGFTVTGDYRRGAATIGYSTNGTEHVSVAWFYPQWTETRNGTRELHASRNVYVMAFGTPIPYVRISKQDPRPITSLQVTATFKINGVARTDSEDTWESSGNLNFDREIRLNLHGVNKDYLYHNGSISGSPRVNIFKLDGRAVTDLVITVNFRIGGELHSDSEAIGDFNGPRHLILNANEGDDGHWDGTKWVGNFLRPE